MIIDIRRVRFCPECGGKAEHLQFGKSIFVYCSDCGKGIEEALESFGYRVEHAEGLYKIRITRVKEVKE